MSALAVAGRTEPGERFTDVEVEKSFRPFLLTNPLLMEVAGAKVIRLDKGRRVVLAVASTALKDKSGKDRLRAEKVCRVKALASVVAEKGGVQVCHVERVKEMTVIVIEDGKEKGKSVSELLSMTRTKVEGVARDMPVVGRWKSKDGEVFYLAIGVVLDKDGEPVPDEMKD
jgi:urease gamma subunit